MREEESLVVASLVQQGRMGSRLLPWHSRQELRLGVAREEGSFGCGMVGHEIGLGDHDGGWRRKA